jgi:diadenosine tetraphosphate (Ap4A) HIT family hydrolase
MHSSMQETQMPETGWSLHPQLRDDTVAVGDLALSRVLAMNAADYPWLILVPRRVGLSELIDLDLAASVMVMKEIELISRALKPQTRCDKLNIAAIGNVVPQLHIHIVARRTDDPLWPKPVWGAAPLRPYDAVAMQRFVAAMRDRLGSALHPAS